MPIAVLVAAFAVPVVYIASAIYDVNLWEDEPLIVIRARLLLTGALTVALPSCGLISAGPRHTAPQRTRVRWSVPAVGTFLLVLLVPIVRGVRGSARSCWPAAPSSTT